MLRYQLLELTHTEMSDSRPSYSSDYGATPYRHLIDSAAPSRRALPDGGVESGEQPSRGAGHPSSVPDWVPTDTVITDYPDRQVLVVGDTVAGLALTLLLRNAGYDPLVVGGTGRPFPSRVAHVSPPALRTLDAIGVGTTVRNQGTTVDSVSVHRSGSPTAETTLSETASPEGALPLVVSTERLYDALSATIPEGTHRGDRTVETVSRRDSGLTVEFADGVREWFDVVVDAGGGGASLRSDRKSIPATDTLTQYELPLDTDTAARGRLRELWCSDAFVQQLPAPNGSGSVLRVTTPRSDSENALDGVDWNAFLPNAGVDVASALAAVEPTRVHQASLSDAEIVSERWGTNRVCFCGPAAWPAAPASGFDVTFGIEDAVAFVSELTDATRSATGVVDTYSSRRARRFATLGKTVETTWSVHEYPPRQPTDPALGSLSALRAVTLGPFLGSPMTSLQRAGFGAE